MPESRKVFEVEDSDFSAIHHGQGHFEPADRGREWMFRTVGGRAGAPLSKMELKDAQRLENID